MALEKPKLERTVAEIGDTLISTYHFKTLNDTQEILYYSKEGVYKSGGERIIEQTIRQQIDREISKHDMAEIIYYVKNMTGTERIEFDKDPDWLHCSNGWINVYTGEFKEHSPEMLSIRKLPEDYVAGAKCPEILRFLDTTLDPEQTAVVLRMIAYCLLPSSKYETAFILNGEGSNGKSTLIKLIKALLGAENCSAVSLQDLTGDRFAKAELYSKMANMFADLKSERVKEGDFKPIVSGDRIRAQKKFGQPFEFENTAKLIFATNNIPESEDDSYAYFRRWVIVPFNRTFEGENRDIHLIDKLTTPEELSGLLYWALIMLKQLMRENGFEHSDIEEIRKQYQLGASKIQDFIDECCILGEVESVRTTELHNSLANYCRSKGSNFIDIRELGKKLAAIGIEHKKKRVKGLGQPYFYFGIGLKTSGTVGQTEPLLFCTTMKSIVQGNGDDSTIPTVTVSEGVTT